MTEKKAKYEAINKEWLAEAIIRWSQQRRYLDELERMITDRVLQLGETVVVGYARATYYNPRKTYDYQAAAHAWAEETEVSPEDQQALLAKHTEVKQTVTINWKAICDQLTLDVPFTESEPRVVLKMDGEPPMPPAYDGQPADDGLVF